jgi:pyruvate carboxylase
VAVEDFAADPGKYDLPGSVIRFLRSHGATCRRPARAVPQPRAGGAPAGGPSAALTDDDLCGLAD